MSPYSSSENKYYAIISMSCLFLSCTKKTQLKEQQRFYIVHQDEDDLLSFESFHELHSSHWGAKIQFITGDSWYSSTENLKTIRKYGIRFMFGF